jgi:fucose 4-O-acetylase-like acetyltransferase
VVKKIEIPYLLNPYLHHELSNFPLFPWAGFLFLGVLAAYAYSVLRREIFFRFCLIFGAAIFPWYFFFKSETFIKAELTLTGNLNKLGGVLLLLWFSERIVCRWKGKTITLMTRAGKESLFVYVLHLFIIFGSVFSPGLQPLLENTMTLPQATGLFLLLQTIVFGLSLTYGYLKDKKKPVWRWSFNAFWAGFFILFALKRW